MIKGYNLCGVKREIPSFVLILLIFKWLTLINDPEIVKIYELQW